MANMSEFEEAAAAAGPGTSILLAFFGGVVMGAAAGILLAPRPGQESRERLRNYIRKTQDDFRSMTRRAEKTAERAADKAAEAGRRFVDESVG